MPLREPSPRLREEHQTARQHLNLARRREPLLGIFGADLTRCFAAISCVEAHAIFMIETPAITSPARIARWWAAPRQRGSGDACTFRAPQGAEMLHLASKAATRRWLYRCMEEITSESCGLPQKRVIK